MQLTNLLAIGALIACGTASPAPAPTSILPSRQWVLESFTRSCNAEDTSCHYSYKIRRTGEEVTQCDYTITGSPASRTTYSDEVCGAFTATGSYTYPNKMYPPGETTAYIQITKENLFIRAEFNDSELASGQTVSPDKRYISQPLK